MRRIPLRVLPLLLILAAAVLAVRAEPAGDGPGAQPTTRPAASADPGLPDLAEPEWELWGKAFARRGQHPSEDAAVYMLLAKLAETAPLSPTRVAMLREPDYASLLSWPAPEGRPALQVLRVPVRVRRVRALTAAHRPASEHWPADRPVYEIEATLGGEAAIGTAPLLIYAAEDLDALLGEPDAAGEDDGVEFRRYAADAPAVEAVALTYKIHEPAGGEAPHPLPVLVAKQFQAPGAATEARMAELNQPVPKAGLLPLTKGQWESWRQSMRNADRDPLLEPSLYAVLAHTQGLPRLSEQEISRLDRPGYTPMVEDPGAYVRLPIRAVRVAAKASRVYVVHPGDRGALPRMDYWPADRKLYMIHALRVSEQEGPLEPLILYMAEDPGDVLGEPDSTGEADGMPYREYRGNLPDFDAVCVYYKAYRGQERGEEGKQRRWPTLVAVQLVGEDDAGISSSQVGILVAIALMGLALFVYFKRKTRSGTGGEAVYEPLRDKPDAPPEETGDEPVDPDLKAAVEDYKKHRQEQYGDEDDSS